MDIRWLNTKFDYEYVRKNFPEEIWRAKYQALLDDRMQWLNTRKLNQKADGVTIANQKKVVTNKKDDGMEEYYQYEFKEDPNCKLKRLGFSMIEVLSGLE